MTEHRAHATRTRMKHVAVEQSLLKGRGHSWDAQFVLVVVARQCLLTAHEGDIVAEFLKGGRERGGATYGCMNQGN